MFLPMTALECTNQITVLLGRQRSNQAELDALAKKISELETAEEKANNLVTKARELRESIQGYTVDFAWKGRGQKDSKTNVLGYREYTSHTSSDDCAIKYAAAFEEEANAFKNAISGELIRLRADHAMKSTIIGEILSSITSLNAHKATLNPQK